MNTQAARSRPRPPLTKRLQPGHWLALDCLGAGCVMLMLFLDSRYSVAIFLPYGGAQGLPVLLAVGGALPVAFRRLRPVAALVASIAVVALVTVVSLMSDGTIAPSSTIAFLIPVACTLHLVAAQSERSRALGWLGVVIALAAAMYAAFEFRFRFGEGRSAADGAVTFGLMLVIVWTVGYGIGQRRRYAASLQEQAAASAVTSERLRIARELHDVVAHSMTVVAVQAGYGHHVIDTQPGQAREALGAIQATSREALADLRRMLGVLRQTGLEPAGLSAGRAWLAQPEEPADGVPPLAPAPGLADLERLVSRIGLAGVKVDLQERGERPELPPGIDLTAFRIVQEALTNVVKHAQTADCQVSITCQDGWLSVEITDEGRGAAAPAGDESGGHGLIGMRERVATCGGMLAAGPLPGRGFRVAAQLPLPEAAQ